MTDDGGAVKILIAGGAGYIGATIASACEDAGHVPVILDDFSTGHPEYVRDRIVYHGDIANAELIARIVHEHPDIFAVIHCAARIVVPESVADPLAYYAANVSDTVVFLRALESAGLTRVVFSSSASVYASADGGGIDEQAPLAPLSPYARTKAMVEAMLSDAGFAGQLRALSLRYFNPIGVDPEGRSGPTSDRPSHVLGLLMRAARDGTTFTITGTDWPTRDGSGLRDFIHVWDLALAHVRAVERFDDVVPSDQGHRVLNIGTGRGTTVRELVEIFREVSGMDVTVAEGPRRAGDAAGGFALVNAAEAALQWRAERSIPDAVRSALQWQNRPR